MVVDTINTRYGEIEIEAVDWHRGLFPLPKGSMYISDEMVKKIARKYGLDKKWELVSEFLNYCNINIYSVEFSSSYTEFLYPGSPSYGFNVHVAWIEDSIEDGYLEEFVEYVSRKDKAFLIKNKENIEKFLDSINDVYYWMLCDLYSYVEDLKKEAYEYE
jgi:hypothetical protein